MIGALLCLEGAAPATPAAIGRWHEDADAGVRFRLPFSVYQVKTGAQVEALIRQQNQTIPPTVRYTGGIYGHADAPYILVWTAAAAASEAPATVLPSRLSLSGIGVASVDAAVTGFGDTRLKFSKKRLVAVGPVFDAGDGLKVRLIAQLTRGATVYLGYFFKDEADEAGVNVLAGSLQVASAKRLTWDELPWIDTATWQWLALLLFAPAVAIGIRFSRRVWLRA